MALLNQLLESAGFTVVSALIPDVRKGRCDVAGFIARHDPAVVVYDIGLPYEENWAMFEQLRASSMRDRRFVITSADAERMERLAGQDERIFEIVDRPFDLNNLVQAVKEATRARRVIRAVGRSQQTRSSVTATPERRLEADRRHSSWTSNDIYQKLREKREEVEFERRRFGRRATDTDHGPSSHAA
jgi:DNA-binding response OmpR family regulator